jgi:adenylate kinase
MSPLKTLILLGRPGCGKGTQASMLLQTLPGFSEFSMGDRFRAIAKEDTFLGRKVDDTINAGLLTPHWFAAYLFEDHILKLDPEVGVIYEGVARRPQEASDLHQVMEWLNRPYRVLHLDVPEAVIIERLHGRGRADDKQKSIEVRLEEYRAHTEASLSFFRERGVVVEINGDQGPEDVHREIILKLDQLTK